MSITFDRVHDTQTAYRKTLDGLSRPGTIMSLAAEAKNAEGMLPGCFASTTVMAIMLLDTEVTFKVVSAREQQITSMLNQLTYAKATDATKADYIFVLRDAATVDFEQALQAAKIGTLEDTHQSATFIIETAGITNDPTWRLVGPGILDMAYANMGLDGRWSEIRAVKNDEYPLGIDLFFTDSEFRLLGIPRTTQLARQVND